MRRIRRRCFVAIAAAVLACGCDDASVGAVDFGARGRDAAEPPSPTDDAGTDAESLDASDARAPAPDDGGSLDLGPPPDRDAGPPAPPVPVLRSPWNGWTSGSPHAAPDGPARDPLRPTLRWERSLAATSYVVELTDACELETYRDCDFASAVTERIAGGDQTRFTPAARLTVATAAPVGRRYYWRVQACDADEVCSAFSAVRYFDVGRLHDDFDGDGYSDLVAGAPNMAVGGVMDVGGAWVFAGSALGVSTTPSIELEPVAPDIADQHGKTIVALGDVNGDGFADLAIGQPFFDTVHRGALVIDVGRVHVYYGSAAGLRALPDATLDYPASPATAWFGSWLAGGEDIDADGYADLLAGAEQRGRGAVFVFRGGALGVSPDDLDRIIAPAEVDHFGLGLGSPGDVDGDGFSDALIGAFATSVPSTHAGWAGLYLGSSTGLRLAPSGIVAPEPEPTWIELGWRFGTPADFDGDGFADVVVSAPYLDVVEENEGAVFVLTGSRDGIAAEPTALLSSADPQEGVSFGADLATGDFDGDGLDDVVAGVPLATTDGVFRAGRAWVFSGTADLAMAPATRSLDPTVRAETRFGNTMADGDFDGDGFVDVVVGAPFENEAGLEWVGALYVFAGGPDGLDAATPTRIASPIVEARAQIGWGLD